MTQLTILYLVDFIRVLFLIGILFTIIVLIGIFVTKRKLSCVKCGHITKQGSFRIWQILISLLLFPLGLLSLLAGRKPTVCEKCGHTWIP